MSDAQEENCVSCLFYHSVGKSESGICRRHAPQPMTALIPQEQVGGPGMRPIVFHPPTRATSWCGEYEYRGT